MQGHHLCPITVSYLQFNMFILYLLLATTVTSVTKVDLNGRWDFCNSTGIVFPADIPSTLHLDLMKNGLIPDPYFGDNLLSCYIENQTWWYNRTFLLDSSVLASRHKYLVFEGLDTHCNVSLNGRPLFTANNMFRKWRIPAINLNTSNTLSIQFFPNAAVDLQAQEQLISKTGITLPANYSFSRKAAYQYGWDWGPRLLTLGIWKDVYVEAYNSTYLEWVWVRNDKVEKGVNSTNLTVQVSLAELNVSSGYKVNVEVVGNGTHKGSVDIGKGNQTYTARVVINIAKPILWWTRDVGTPFLYNISVAIQQNNQTILTKSLRYGIRTVAVSQTPDKSGNGSEFTVILNNIPLFMRGGNYIPPDMFMPRALKNPSVYTKTIQAAVFGNFNMLRVWGGGQFDHDIFYDLCDENGLLIWHDLMFACAMYPGGKEIYENIRQEMIDNLIRLRNHPSIAIWNGNNEVWIGWLEWGWQNGKTAEQKKMLVDWYNGIFEVTIPQVLGDYDSDRFYWPTSPSTSAGDSSKLNHGDIHFWRVWAMGTPLEEYKEYIGRFNSEYGMQSVPEYSSIIRFTSQKDRTIDSEVMALHQRHINGWYLLPNYTAQYAGNSSDLERYSYFSQIMQAYGIQMAIDSLRAAKPFCMGSLFWQLNDVWPVSSWATVDYYGMYKAAQYSARNAYSTAYALAQYSGTLKMTQIRIINDDIVGLSCQLKIQFLDFGGRQLKKSITQSQNIAAGYNNIVLNITDSELTDIFPDPSKSLIILTLNSTKFGVLQYLHYFKKPIQLRGTPPTITFTWHNSTSVNVSTTTLAKSVYLYDKTRTPLQLKTNYFDIKPNSYQIVTLPYAIDKEFLGYKEYFTERHYSLQEKEVKRSLKEHKEEEIII